MGPTTAQPKLIPALGLSRQEEDITLHSLRAALKRGANDFRNQSIGSRST